MKKTFCSSCRWIWLFLLVLLTLDNLWHFVMAITVMAMGLFIYLNPEQVIAMQKSFYRLINWDIEPISMPKEIRNTRMMGFILIVFAGLSCIVTLWD